VEVPFGLAGGIHPLAPVYPAPRPAPRAPYAYPTLAPPADLRALGATAPPAVNLVQNIDIGGATAADPAPDDQLLGYDTSAAANRKFRADRLLALGVMLPGGRLTLSTGTPVPTADVTAAGTLYYTPWLSDRIQLYDGTRWANYTFAERSLALSGLTANLPYDVYLYDNAGTLTLTLQAWMSDTLRNTSFGLSGGRLTLLGDATRLYLGTIRTTGTTTSEDSKAKRFVWNAYNRVPKYLRVVDTTDTWTYGTASWRYANNTSANRVEFVTGWETEIAEAIASATASLTSSANYTVGVGLDQNTGNDAATRFEASGAVAGGSLGYSVAFYRGVPISGYHYLAWVEYARAGTPTVLGDAGTVTIQSGLQATVWC
jgi:hypothetical protein